MEKHFNTIKETFEIQNGIKVYNFNWCLNYIEYQGKLIYGRSFKIEDIDHQTIFKLVIYAIRDEKKALELDLDLNKGMEKVQTLRLAAVFMRRA